MKHLFDKQLLVILLLLLTLPLSLFLATSVQDFRQQAASKNGNNKNENNKNDKNKKNNKKDKNKKNTSSASSSEKPNVIIILSDDQPDDTLQYVPGTRDRLGSNGVTFTNAFATTGLCCPSRSSILTGQYTHNHGVWNNRAPYGIKAFKDQETLPVWLKKAGYTTALVGKYLNFYDSMAPYIPPGWDHWAAFDDKNGKYFDYKLTINKKSKSFGKKENDYSTDVLAKEAAQFIKKAKDPFFLYFAPHTPHGAPKEAPRHTGKCDRARLKKGPNYNENDVSDKPQWIKKLPKLSDKEVKDQEDEFQKKMCTMKALDEAVNEILKALGNKRDNTLIIYTSDNGYVFGEHRWAQKECFYKECIGVDMIISYPKLTSGKKTSAEYALNIDLAPTILDIAGIPIPSTVDGKSLKPLLQNPATQIHESFLIETYNNETNPKGQDFGLQTKKYKYQELTTGEKELYDLEKDPHEMNNLANKPEVKQIQEELAKQLATMKTAKGNTSPTPSASASGTTTPTPKPSSTTPTPSGSKTPTPSGASVSPTNTSKQTTISFSIALHGIGSSGDASNKADSMSNKNPKTKNRDITIELLDENNKTAKKLNGTITYDTAKGIFTGLVPVADVTGLHTVKIHTANYLTKHIPTIVNFGKSSTITLPQTILIVGDVTNDNVLNIHDYNALIACYDKKSQGTCKGNSDLNDDGNTDGKDVNLWLREIISYQGD